MFTMTTDERETMREHSEYWRGFADKGWAVACGPVADVNGGYGVWALPDDVEPHPLMQNDPTIEANAGFGFEVHPMPALVRTAR